MSSARPLSGLVVVEIGHSIAAPYAGMILGELGAEVIKVENPTGGDACRGWGPPFAEGAATCFHAVNRGKQGVAIDLADPTDSARLKALIVERADVVIHNLKFGALDKYGLGPAALVAEKPSLVCCGLNAFGATGPLRERPGYDPMMQAYSGLMSLLGEDGRPPVRVTASIIDMGSATWSVVGILAALRERDRTGKGGVVDTSLYETSLALMSIMLADHLASGNLPVRHGSGVAMIVPYQAFEAADGYMMVAAGNDNLFRKFCDVLGRTELVTDPAYVTNSQRVINRERLIPIVAEAVAKFGMDELGERLDAAGVPNSPLLGVEGVAHHPQTKALDATVTCDDNLSLVSIPLSFDGVRPRNARRAPKLGEHNRKNGTGHD